MNRSLLVSAISIAFGIVHSATVPADETVSVVGADGSTIEGQVAELTSRSLVIKTGDNRNKTVDLAEVIRVQWPNRVQHQPRATSVIFLANGDRILGEPIQTDDERMTAKWTHYSTWSPNLSIPLEAIRGFVYSAPNSRPVRHRLFKSVNHSETQHDIVIRQNGDQITGEWIGFRNKQLSINTSVGELKISSDELRAVVFNSQLVSFPNSDGLRVLLKLTDGSRLTVQNLKLATTELLSFDALFGTHYAVPLSAVAGFQILGGRAVYLSDLQPTEYQFSPYLSERWQLRRDHNVLGGPLRLRGVEYGKGLGMHSRSSVTFNLDGKYQLFQAKVGIDDDAKGHGSVTFAVDVDDRRVLTTPVITGQTPIQVIQQGVNGAKTLTLKVDFGQLGDVRDYANWCDALLIKKRDAE